MTYNYEVQAISTEDGRYTSLGIYDTYPEAIERVSHYLWDDKKYDSIGDYFYHINMIEAEEDL